MCSAAGSVMADAVMTVKSRRSTVKVPCVRTADGVRSVGRSEGKSAVGAGDGIGLSVGPDDGWTLVDGDNVVGLDEGVEVGVEVGDADGVKVGDAIVDAASTATDAALGKVHAWSRNRCWSGIDSRNGSWWGWDVRDHSEGHGGRIGSSGCWCVSLHSLHCFHLLGNSDWFG